MNSEKVTKNILLVSSIILILLATGIVLTLISGSIPVFEKFGFQFIFSNKWNPTTGREQYGAFPFIVGTVVTSILALIICIPLAFSASLFIGEYYKGKMVSKIIGTLVDLLAGIPSIVYGLWGFYFLRPLIVHLGLNAQGFGIFTSSIILAIMIVPYATSISTEIISLVPNHLKEAAYSLGATRMEVIFNVTVPAARSGIIASYILALGRALGETMAVTMLIGNSNRIPHGIFDLGNTMASIIANQFGEAEGIQFSALIAIALLLFLITGLINGIGKLIIKKFA
ncbi:MAG: phosphate ABC transporter permease subunit PstC [Peptostreptococcaceae bacterium]|nr:phosphate ABC transporter permease subunit PstC [Peptostreptococcaceae bacterium]